MDRITGRSEYPAAFSVKSRKKSVTTETYIMNYCRSHGRKWRPKKKSHSWNTLCLCFYHVLHSSRGESTNTSNYYVFLTTSNVSSRLDGNGRAMFRLNHNLSQQLSTCFPVYCSYFDEEEAGIKTDTSSILLK